MSDIHDELCERRTAYHSTCSCAERRIFELERQLAEKDKAPAEARKENMRLKEAIRSSDVFADGYCIVCSNHTDRHSNNCPMKGGGK